MQTIQAIPTRYKGIVYRSRSEARFAAFLHFSGCGFTYEPEFLKLPNLYVPDFAIFFPLRVIDFGEGEFNVGFPMNLTVIDYKPTMPNDEWRDSIHVNFKDISRKLASFGLSQFEFCLVVGNIYDDEGARKVFRFNRDTLNGEFEDCSVGGWDQLMRWKYEPEAIQYAKKYRYDLEKNDESQGLVSRPGHHGLEIGRFIAMQNNNVCLEKFSKSSQQETHGRSRIIVCDLSRQIEMRKRFVPQIEDLQPSIENVADVILFCVWPHKIDATGSRSDEHQIFVAKNRGHRRPAAFSWYHQFK